MWIVRLALRRPYTFVVMAVLLAILGGTAIATMPVDIFPYIDIPIVSVVWQYGGLSPDEMEKRVVTNFERGLTSNVNDIEHIEDNSYNGFGIVKIYFQPNVDIRTANAEWDRLAPYLSSPENSQVRSMITFLRGRVKTQAPAGAPTSPVPAAKQQDGPVLGHAEAGAPAAASRPQARGPNC